MSISIENAKPIFELIYYATSPLTLIGVYIGFKQWLALKESENKRFMTEKKARTIEVIETKAKRLVELNEIVMDIENQQHLTLSSTHYSGSRPCKFDAENDKSCGTGFENNDELFAAVTNFLNEVESLAFYVNHDLIDAELGFRLDGRHIISGICRYRQYIIAKRSIDGENAYSQTISLCKHWCEKHHAQVNDPAETPTSKRRLKSAHPKGRIKHLMKNFALRKFKIHQ